MGPDSNPANQPGQGVATGRRTGSGLAGFFHGAATLTVGLVAGIFFDWAVSIMPSLAQSDDRTYVVLMQKTVTTMNNSPLFLFSFMGAFIFTVVAAVFQHRLGARAAFRWIIAGLLLYLVAFLITMGVHLPINDTLEKAGDPDTIDLAALRAETESSWVNAHTARTIAAVGALGCLCRALWVRRG